MTALESTGDPVQFIHVVRTVPEDRDSLLMLPGETAAQLCLVVFNQPETAAEFLRDYPDAQSNWVAVPVAVTDLPAMLQAQVQQGRTHVMVDPQVAAGPIVPAGIVSIDDYITAINLSA